MRSRERRISQGAQQDVLRASGIVGKARRMGESSPGVKPLAASTGTQLDSQPKLRVPIAMPDARCG